MKMHLLAGVALLALLGGSATAADLPVRKAPVAPPVCPTCDWSGFYFGFNVGGSIGRDSTDNTITLSPNAPSAGVTNPISALSYQHSPAGAVGGGQIGFNWQAGKWVFGLEADWDATGQRDTVNSHAFLASTIVVAPASVDYSDEQKIKWLATARARLGWAHDCFLWYVTGGAAWGKVDSNYTFQVTGLNAGGTTVFGTGAAAASFSTTRSGWTIGGGVETSLGWFGLSGNNWSAKFEYLYVDLGTVTNSFTVPLTATPAAFYTFTGSSHIRDHIIRVGVNYRFNYGPGPVAARY
jgi:outer membrane immunogenic protein